MRFRDRTVIVTGGLGGIGRACVRRFVSEGARIVIADREMGDSAAFMAELNAIRPDCAVAMACDVASEPDVIATCDRAEALFGSIDILVNVAGIMIYTLLEELTLADWNRLLGINFVGAALFTTQAFRRMRSGGAIVNIGSIHAFQTSPSVGPYAAAKAALNALTRTAAIEGAAKGIRANAVLPGAIDTPLLRASPNLKSGVEKLEPAYIGKPEHVAAAVAFLASDDAAFITGATLNVDGGRLAKL